MILGIMTTSNFKYIRLPNKFFNNNLSSLVTIKPKAHV